MYYEPVMHFTEDQALRIANNFNCRIHYFMRKHKTLLDKDTSAIIVDDREMGNLYEAALEFESMYWALFNNFCDQFHHSPKARSICPNPDCKGIYAYFFEDWKHCPKCGTKLEFSYINKEDQNDQNS